MTGGSSEGIWIVWAGGGEEERGNRPWHIERERESGITPRGGPGVGKEGGGILLWGGEGDGGSSFFSGKRGRPD